MNKSEVQLTHLERVRIYDLSSAASEPVNLHFRQCHCYSYRGCSKMGSANKVRVGDKSLQVFLGGLRSENI